MQPNFLKYLERRVPRYTSYPTAVQFGPEVSAAGYADWLADLPGGAPLSLYVHVPFCAELCFYCGCNTTVVRRYEPVAAYVKLLEREIAMVGAIVKSRGVGNMHWGGGTPTMLAVPDFTKVMEGLRAQFDFAPDAELAIEIDPRTITRDYTLALAQLGINRASLGVQDFDEQVQRTVGRMQSAEQTAHVVDWFREAGVNGINLDLMYGLPFQTEATLEQTIERALKLDADRIALFGYAHVPWMKKHQQLIPEQALPGTSERFAQSRLAADMLIGAGYEPVGLDHFAKSTDLLAQRRREARLHRNFQGYTTDESEALLGFGTSAIGSLPQGYVQNAASTVAYREAISAGRLATVRGRALTTEDRIRRDIITSLMCNLHVDLAEICALHETSADRFAAELANLDGFVRDGLVELAGSEISLPEQARPFVRTVCAAFDQYLTKDETRFSRAS
ncbi:MAG: oxygen-independent coproporphyrinogen III oxidase [Xanthobacteraceae bacterium]|jgi:oxygen-independent coproporphyrinogen-3 oxidase